MTPDKTMHTRLESLFSTEDTLTHLDLNGLLCDVNPDSMEESLFSSVLVGTSSMTLKEEYASFVECNENPESTTHYCLVCLFRLEKKLR